MPDAIATVTALKAQPQTESEPVKKDQMAPQQLSSPLVVRLTVYIISLSFVLFYLLIRIWPGTVPPEASSKISLAWSGRMQFTIGLETRYMLIVLLSGALGSYIHLATSFADYVGNRTLKPCWEVWYLLRPFIGAALAIIVYFVVRAGLITGSGAQQMSLYGVAATAAMCGLFSKQATDKLQAVFEEAFRTKHGVKRADPLTMESDHSAKA